jgi:rubrerythrin
MNKNTEPTPEEMARRMKLAMSIPALNAELAALNTHTATIEELEALAIYECSLCGHLHWTGIEYIECPIECGCDPDYFWRVRP